MIKKISNIGDSGIACDFGEDVDKKTNSKEAIRVAKKTITILISYTKYKEAIKANPIIL